MSTHDERMEDDVEIETCLWHPRCLLPDWTFTRASLVFRYFYCCQNLWKTPVVLTGKSGCDLTACWITFLLFNQNNNTAKMPFTSLARFSEEVIHFSPGEVDSSFRINLLHLQPAVRKQHTGGFALICSSCTLHLLTSLHSAVTAPDNFLLILLPRLPSVYWHCMKENRRSTP